MVSKRFVLEFSTIKTAQQVTVSHSRILFIVYRESLQNNSNLEYMKIKTSPNRGPCSLCAHACKPGHSLRQSTEYNMGDIGKSLKIEN
jgi:hypothetical protein